MPKNKSRSTAAESDSKYFLKLVIYLILGAFWVRFSMNSWQLPLPIGLLIGLFLASRERFRVDRKLEYAVLLLAMFVGFWLPLGLELRL